MDVAYAQLKGTEGNYTLLSANYTVKKEGYAYVYISNENTTAVDVYFDDITMTYTPTNVIQYNEYYPFGLQTADSWTRDNSSNNFLYNEGSELNQTSGFYDLPFRNYDVSLGRFFQVDPLSHLDNATSPFVYAGNNPVVFNDPQGLMVSAAGLSDYQLRMMYRRDMASYSSYDDWASQNVIEYVAGKGFDAAGGSGGSMWGSWSKTPIFGLVQGRKPRYETEGNDYKELGIVGYEWTYTPGTGRSPFDQVMGDPAGTSGGKPQGNWGGEHTNKSGPGDPKPKLAQAVPILFEVEELLLAVGLTGANAQSDINSAYHANDKRSAKPNYVYEIVAVIPGDPNNVGIKRNYITIKYGISSDNGYRVRSQVDRYNQRNDGLIYSSYIRNTNIPSRAQALVIEQFYVTMHLIQNGFVPRDQYRPAPWSLNE